MTLTLPRLKELLDYNPELGDFTWLVQKKQSRFKRGDKAGSTNSKGYRVIRIDGKDYKAHRLAWLYMTGEWPGMIDHKNRVRADNRWENLRLATPSLNALNKTPHKLSSSGIRGVYNHGRQWIAYVGRNAKKRTYLPTFEEAVEARKALELTMH